MKKTIRPEMAPNSKKISHKNEFELCYLRHHYLRRSTENPELEDILPYRQIIKRLSNNTFLTYQALFNAAGMDFDDLVSASEIHLVSFLNLFSTEKFPKKKFDSFVSSFKKKNGVEPTEKDILDNNKAIFTLFLKQRMEDTVRIVRQKIHNIRGKDSKEFTAFQGDNVPPSPLKLLLESASEYGYVQISVDTFKKNRKKAKASGSYFFFENKWYVSIPILHTALVVEDFNCNDLDPYDNIHNMSPDRLIMIEEDEKEDINKKLLFQSMEDEDKIMILKRFLKENESNKHLSKEIKTAKKMLGNLQ